MQKEDKTSELFACKGSGAGEEEVGLVESHADVRVAAEGLPQESRASWMTETAGRDILTGRISEPAIPDPKDSNPDSKPKVQGRINA